MLGITFLFLPRFNFCLNENLLIFEIFLVCLISFQEMYINQALPLLDLLLSDGILVLSIAFQLDWLV